MRINTEPTSAAQAHLQAARLFEDMPQRTPRRKHPFIQIANSGTKGIFFSLRQLTKTS
jgi:hypothetical protein